MVATVTYLRDRRPARHSGPRPSLIQQTAALLIKGRYSPDYALSLGADLGFEPATTWGLYAAMAAELAAIAQGPAPF